MSSVLPSPTTHLLYLHGFRSSPRSAKATQLGEAFRTQFPQVTWHCPQLSHSPADAMASTLVEIAGWPAESSAVVGSSLGGFYARWLGLKLGWKRVLLNPAVFPARDLARYIGPQTAWHDPQSQFEFRQEHVDALKTMEAELDIWAARHPATPDRQLAIIQQGDEVLDWREMSSFAAGGDTLILPDGDHAISDFERHIPRVLRFLHPAPS